MSRKEREHNIHTEDNVQQSRRDDDSRPSTAKRAVTDVVLDDKTIIVPGNALRK